jgi:hypothetical protein
LDLKRGKDVLLMICNVASADRQHLSNLFCICRTLDLEAQLQDLQDAAAARERELGDLVDQLRREKQEAEARAAGVNMAKIRVSLKRYKKP